jgi:antitoxin component YwqK of YwqJK toxin-antitoxin module
LKFTTSVALIISFALSVTLLAQDQNGKTIEKIYWKNNNLRAEITYNSNRCWDGVLKTYYPTGSIESILYYMPISSMLRGTQNDPTLTLEEKLAQTGSGRIGFSIYYYDNGQISNITPYYYGKKHGRILSFYRTGELQQISYVHEGVVLGGIKLSSMGSITWKDESNVCAVKGTINDNTYYNPIKKQSIYNSFKVLEAWESYYPSITKDRLYGNYLYYGKHIEDMLAMAKVKTPPWSDLVSLKNMFDKIDAINLKMDKYWKKQRLLFRNAIVKKASEQKIQIKDTPPLIDGGLVRELLTGAKEAADLETKEEFLLEAQQILEDLNQYSLKYTQQEEIDDMLEEIKALLDESVDPSQVREAVAAYLNEDENNPASTDELVELALNKIIDAMASNNNVMSEDEISIFINDGLFDYLADRANITPSDSPKKSAYEFQVIAWGSLLVGYKGELESIGASYEKLTSIIANVGSIYDLKSKVESPADFIKLKTEFEYRRKSLNK